MRRMKSLLVLVAPLLVSAAGCGPNSPFGVLVNPPECSIINIQKLNAVWPEPAKIILTVRNTGEATAYDISCDITLKSGSTIMDEGAIYFGTLESGESISGEASFANIASHSEYAVAAYHLSWYDSQGTYHE